MSLSSATSSKRISKSKVARITSTKSSSFRIMPISKGRNVDSILNDSMNLYQFIMGEALLKLRYKAIRCVDRFFTLKLLSLEISIGFSIVSLTLSLQV